MTNEVIRNRVKKADAYSLCPGYIGGVNRLGKNTIHFYTLNFTGIPLHIKYNSI